jgi:hypothetical protein
MHHLSLDVTDLDPLLRRLEGDGIRIVDRFDAGDATSPPSSRRSARRARAVLAVPEIVQPGACIDCDRVTPPGTRRPRMVAVRSALDFSAATPPARCARRIRLRWQLRAHQLSV